MTGKKELKFINYRKYILFFIIMTVFIVGLNIMFRVSPVFAHNYSTKIFDHTTRFISAAMSVFPFSVIEFLCYGALITVIFCIVRLIVFFINNRPIFFYKLKRCALNLACIVMICLLIFTLNDFVLYNRMSFTACAYINMEEHSKKELAGLFKILAKDANSYSYEVSRDSDGTFVTGNTDLNEVAKAAMKSLKTDYPFMPSYYPDAKPVMSSQIMTYTFTQGFYSPLTLEANYNKNMPDVDIPHTICHELAHIGGFIHEDEANFIGYLACIRSENAAFVYSGTISMLTYVMNSMYDAFGPEEYYNYTDLLNDSVKHDISDESQYWSRHKTSIAEISNAYNDAYIKFNGDDEGDKRYGMVVDLLLEYYEDSVSR